MGKDKINEIIKKTNSFLCIDCGECTGSCPISRVNVNYSPRLNVEKIVLGYFDEIKEDENIWSCLACGLCTKRCPSNVEYDEFVRLVRKEVRSYNNKLNYSHNRIVQKTMEIMAQGNPQNRTEWLDKKMKVSKKGKYLYFTGCLPYFEIIFEYLKIHPIEIAKNSVRILNHLGIKPVISNSEVCCGRDLLYNGDEENFLKLARINKRIIKESGAEKIVFTCPEGLEAFKEIYPSFIGKIDAEFIHITQLVDEAVKKGRLHFNSSTINKVTYQDPCILGRGLGIYDAPRNIINSIPGLELVPMEREKEDSICCGPSAWVSCSNYTKRIQHVRLKQAENTGAEVLVTACPKCTIHLGCALSGDDVDYKIKIKDITTIIVEALKGENGKKK